MEIRLPRLGEGAESGAVANIFVKEGDTLQKDQPMIELESEKAVAAIPSPATVPAARRPNYGPAAKGPGAAPRQSCREPETPSCRACFSIRSGTRRGAASSNAMNPARSHVVRL